MSFISLRSSDRYRDVLGVSANEEHLKITGSRLPSYKQVLLCFLSNYEKIKVNTNKSNSSRPKWEAAKSVAKEVLIHYNKSNIKSQNEKKIAEKIENLYNELQTLSKRKNKNKTENFKKK